MKKTLVAAAVGLFLAPATAHAAKCKDYKTCAEAVRNWCAGKHNGADRDGDKIPCENVCKSRKQSRDEARKIGCTKAD